MAARKSSKKPNVSAEELTSYYRDMLLIRRFEEKAGQLYGMGLIGGFCHLYIGQEAVVVGLEAAAEEGDKRITSYRDHGHMLACGMDPNGVMAELTGREGGYSKGKGGSMHMFSKEKHFYGGHGIVAAQVPLGAGLAFADQYKGNGRVTFTYFGDGAANQGQVYETFNMAALWKLPVIFVIENNQYAMGTSQQRSTSSAEIWERGRAFGIPGEAVDGMDVLAVKEAGQKAVEHARKDGPYILEIKTYRYRGHSMSDPAKYRTREEVQKMRDERDPIEAVRSLLLEGNHASEEDLKAIDKEIKQIVNESADFAKESPEPNLDELWTDIYATEVPQEA
ncbi:MULTISPECIES: pyruvate dehydrogenase (acetyl-transferring) E1 component subunit alpha [Sulfitobacter]|jgi:pyruvate dehydrogenase E1 component alpha subunit|uniref:pyruvate dehydrogenase (acetyl-transferring) E1 component subunit alpha n=1 Tax=Sulfitobacter TaxID=60136 RepID=UPI0007C2D80A|nr:MULTISPECIES: pyruvate dehydrogenase (acetyl-transferring) E1 component subunit alpha [Sulfitobacter]KZY51380.1 pyruvate dehydrogenase (acetyl-transferring) E1 component subunit alpha [Sulfitobacter sp. HI0054]MBO9437769.1 pyruvate dehydrogenase (acetyl-transferring) E1 component subunit alpha [Sulfitobacter sp. R18_2]MDF3382785.1 pyruvate dehydrogenase (acetyl-transferring) E1 component subunit alpha [Sulfitobacter sp. Ks11]MDF3386204.1 pyruvate dehydrogenase (acetyl-transferring) E1 compon